jgi:hypothetical protein
MLTLALQLSGNHRLSANARSVPVTTPLSGTQRARDLPGAPPRWLVGLQCSGWLLAVAIFVHTETRIISTEETRTRRV